MPPNPNITTENELGYYGWRVVLAACVGVMAGFGSLFVYTFSVFVKPPAAEFGNNTPGSISRVTTTTAGPLSTGATCWGLNPAWIDSDVFAIQLL